MSKESNRAEPAATLLLSATGHESGELVEVQPGERVVVGRAPDGAKLADEAPTRAVRIESSAVSANHLIAWLDGDELCLKEVGSRNGSWLRLPAQRVVRFDAAEPLSLWLGRPATRGHDDDVPDDASWSDDADYGQAVARAVSGWLERRRIAAHVGVAPRPTGSTPSHPGQIPLADAHDLVVTPTGTVEVDWPQALGTLWRWVARQNRVYESEKSARDEGMILASDAIRRAHQTVVEAAVRGTRILLVGPSGSGKEELARCYHRASARPGPFVARNCAMFSREFLRAELFGAEQGAFTGATHRIIGAVERAHGGTLFLDEIGDMPVEVQPMLLRFLDRAEFERIGAYGQPRTADVRLVCATNKDLRAASASGEFRADLWYRLSIQVVEVPPLRERPADLAAYLRRSELAPGLSAHDALAPEALPLLLSHRWDGNFRELANFVARLPRDVRPRGIDVATCARALELGALGPSARPPSSPSAPSDSSGWAALTTPAPERIAADNDNAAPGTWDEVKELIEKYLKPLLFAHLAAIEATTSRADVDVQWLARRLDADRGTVQKQLARFLERFGRLG